MAQRSVRRDQEKPVCNNVPRARDFDLDRIRELPYRPATVCRRTRGRTDGSIRPRARTILMFSPYPDWGGHGCCMDPPGGAGIWSGVGGSILPSDINLAVQAEPAPPPPHSQAEAQGHELARV